ncbi:MAG: helix-hairpin-helix domain-containing protein [Dysgonamonadaceae bacterium]|nr:helix-hairpin-helix domain-containing protein [Dysgonamonadaceae bacterium]MDD3309663.1 helix-hairpin-helix domain-containing protein [Dysgonamonadaceae bacterium]MDD3900087.1 helix-hairpin-helix domain-containing protein [Dysgonamonadaceae bacterium]MDD4399213.1 helix-hairpin-helix domain-containing protein [Dysgonamonadaceae bacterium]MEA5081688.1 helix-hairpin-helix domain-containing protein [Dysgonamonadaceae bacterium]
MKWKDLLYYDKSTRIAVLILLVLCVLTLIFNSMLSNRHSGATVAVVNDSLTQEFVEFEKSLIKKEKEGEKKLNDERKQQYYAARSISSGKYDTVNNNVSEDKEYFKSYPKQEKLAINERINLNETDTSEWKKVPGIGSTYASRIVKYRNLLGGYVSVEQLREVYGIDNELFSKIASYIEPDLNYKKIQINRQEFKELNRHPYLSYKQVQAIMELRKRNGQVHSIDELAMLEEFTSDDLIKISPYLEF